MGWESELRKTGEAKMVVDEQDSSLVLRKHSTIDIFIFRDSLKSLQVKTGGFIENTRDAAAAPVADSRDGILTTCARRATYGVLAAANESPGFEASFRAP